VVLVETAPEITVEKARQFYADLYITQYQAGFTFRTYDTVEGWRTAILRWYEGLHSPLFDILGPVKDALRWFWDNILKPPLEALFSGLGTVVRSLIGTVSTIVSGISNVVGSIWSTVRSVVSDIVGMLRPFLEAIANGVRSVAGDVINGMSSALGAVHSALDSVASAMRSGLEWVYNGIVTAMSAVAEKIVSGLSGVASIFKDIGTWIWNGIKALAEGIYHDLIEPILHAIQTVWTTIVGGLSGALYGQGHQAPEGSFDRAMTLWVTSSAIYFAAKTGAQAIESAYITKHLGLPDYVDKVIELGGFTAFGATIYTTMYDAAVRTPLRIEALSKFTPEVLGLSAASSAYATGHMNYDRFIQHVRYAGLGPEYDDFLEWNAYSALATRFLVKLVDAGIYDEEFFTDQLRHQEYAPETIDKVKQFLKISADDAAIAGSFTALRTLFKEGYDTADGISARLDEYRSKATTIERQTLIATWEYEIDFKNDQRALILDQFAKGVIDKSDASSALSKIMPASERVTALLNRAELRRKVEALPSAAEKALTRSEITSAFKAGVIDEDYTIKRLVELGYSEEDIGILVTLYAPKAVATTKKGVIT